MDIMDCHITDNNVGSHNYVTITGNVICQEAYGDNADSVCAIME